MALDATLALPWALMALALALGSRAWPFLILVFPVPLYVAGADLWRELVFHSVIPEGTGWWMPVRGLVLWPICCVALALPRKRSWIWAVGVGLCLLGFGYRLALMDAFEPPLFERHHLNPQ